MMKIVLLSAFMMFTVATKAYAEVATTTMTTTTTTTDAAIATPKLAEDQIPLSIESNKKVSEAGSTSTKALMSMFIIIALAGAGFYYVRKYKTSNSINKSNMQIKVLSQHYLGPKKSLAIIHVAGESILVGVTDHNISMIKSLSLIDDEVPADLPNTFGQTLEKSEAKVMTTAPQGGSRPAIELDEEFSFSNVTENVSKKLKSMRSFS